MPDAVAVTGASYGGGHSWLAALEPTFTSPRGNAVRIRTVVPIAAWSDLLYATHPQWTRARVDRRSWRREAELPERPLRSPASGRTTSRGRTPTIPTTSSTGTLDQRDEPNDIDPIYRGATDGWPVTVPSGGSRRFWRDAAATAPAGLHVQGFTDDLFPMSEA